jgi:hypothetical protein
MRGVHENRLTCLSVDPPGLCPPAREHQRVSFPSFNHTKFELAIEWRARYRLPVEHGARLSRLKNFYERTILTTHCDLSIGHETCPGGIVPQLR